MLAQVEEELKSAIEGDDTERARYLIGVRRGIRMAQEAYAICWIIEKQNTQ